jgi:cytosine/adenosine deaminase-related metal-dependent hydrolase
MNNGVGYMRKLADVKNVALGTDGLGANMFEEAKFAYFKNADIKGGLATTDILKFLQNGNEILARYFGSKFGKIAKGYSADLVVYDYDTPTPLTNENLGGHLLYGFSSRDVATVVVNGKVVYEDREFPFDVRECYAKARSAAQKLWKKMDRIR